MTDKLSLTQTDAMILSYFPLEQQAILHTYSVPTQKALARKIFEQTTINDDFQRKANPKDIIARVVLNDCQVSPKLPKNPAVAGIAALLMGKSNWFAELQKASCTTTTCAILFKRNPQLCSEIHTWLQERLNLAVTEVPNPQMRQVYIRNLLAYLPFFSPVEGSIWNIPVGPDNSPLTYRLERIDLTPRCLGSPLVAYGLVPVGHAGELIVLLKGTPYPANEGSFFSVLADINPFACVGGYAFHFSGKNRLEKWLIDKRKEQPEIKATVIGVSLGGSLALQTAAYLTNYISTVHAFCCPAVTSSEVKAWNKHKLKLGTGVPPAVNIYLQHGDAISSSVGRRWAPDWNTYHLFAPMNSPLQTHSAAYSAQKEAFLIPISAEGDSRTCRRRLWPIVQNFLVIPFFLIGVALLPLFCITHNIIRLAKHCFGEKPKLLHNMNPDKPKARC